MTLFATAFSLGLFGSLHCVGMCGPIAMALPLNNTSNFSRILAALFYNSGRAITYLLIGSIIGLLGKGFSLIGIQQIVSIALGSLILLSYIIPDVFARTKFIIHYNKWFYSVKSGMQFLFKKRSVSSLFFVGMINGLLPCGLVYMAIAAAMALGTVQESALFMMFFGLGTFPMMVSVIFFKEYLSTRFRVGINKALPTIMMVMAVLLIFRGLNLGIPYISPKLNAEKEITCHNNEQHNKLAHACTLPVADTTHTKK